MIYENDQTKFSNTIHDDLMKNNFYIGLFNNKNIKVINTTVTKEGYTKEAQMLDQNYGVDYRVIINDGLWDEMSCTVQERFRDISYKKYQDLTIRIETKCGFKSELSKINAGFFVYGYAETINGIAKANQIIVFNMTTIKMALSMRKLYYTLHKNNDGSEFMAIKFTNLSKIDAIIKTRNF